MRMNESPNPQPRLTELRPTVGRKRDMGSFDCYCIRVSRPHPHGDVLHDTKIKPSSKKRTAKKNRLQGGDKLDYKTRCRNACLVEVVPEPTSTLSIGMHVRENPLTLKSSAHTRI